MNEPINVYRLTSLSQSKALIELRLKVPVNNISVMSRLLTEREGDIKEWDRLKGPNPYSTLPQVKQISSCQQAKYD